MLKHHPRDIYEDAKEIQFSRPRRPGTLLSKGKPNWVLSGQKAARALNVESGYGYQLARAQAPEVEPARTQFLEGACSVLRDRCKREHSTARSRRWTMRVA